MKILYVTTVGGTMPFFKALIRKLLDDGNVVDIASNGQNFPVPDFYRIWGCKIYEISCTRSPYNIGNIEAVFQLKKIVEENDYDIVHCHTPLAAACTRLACKKLRENGLKVIYTAHGFHFYKGAPLKSWMLYYPIEWICAYWTDVLITINTEDFELARKHMHAKRIEYVPGVGLDVEEFSTSGIDRAAKRAEIGIPPNATLLLSVGELNENKNHETVIRAIARMDVYYIIAGTGKKEKELKSIAEEVGMSERVKLLGFRTDVSELNEAADIFVFPSLREGLSVSLMEAMAKGLPVACSKIRGNVDLIDENGGILFDPSSVNECTMAIKRIFLKDSKAMGEYNQKKVKYFSSKVVIYEMTKIYHNI